MYVKDMVIFPYLYRQNYGKDYWYYYEKLIDSVVGSEGYNKFLDNYNDKNYLKRKELSNIILKYDFENEYNSVLNHNIFKPKQHLKFILSYVEDYIMCKFYPPRNYAEYIILKDKYKLMENDMKSYALKHMN